MRLWHAFRYFLILVLHHSKLPLLLSTKPFMRFSSSLYISFAFFPVVLPWNYSETTLKILWHSAQLSLNSLWLSPINLSTTFPSCTTLHTFLNPNRNPFKLSMLKPLSHLFDLLSNLYAFIDPRSLTLSETPWNSSKSLLKLNPPHDTHLQSVLHHPETLLKPPWDTDDNLTSLSYSETPNEISKTYLMVSP